MSDVRGVGVAMVSYVCVCGVLFSMLFSSRCVVQLGQLGAIVVLLLRHQAAMQGEEEANIGGAFAVL
jgi:hypothetical protein